MMPRAAVLWRFLALVETVVADHTGDTQPVVGENLRPALALRDPVRLRVAPRLDRRLVAEDRQRQEFALLAQALEPLHRNEAVDLLQYRLQLGGDVEIIRAVLGLRPDFEDDGDHDKLLW